MPNTTKKEMQAFLHEVKSMPVPITQSLLNALLRGIEYTEDAINGCSDDAEVPYSKDKCRNCQIDLDCLDQLKSLLAQMEAASNRKAKPVTFSWLEASSFSKGRPTQTQGTPSRH